VHQVSRYDTRLGISYWTKNYRTGVEADDPVALRREYAYYDPIYTLPADGQQWWRDRSRDEAPADLALAGDGLTLAQQ
jgi:lysine 2,3-aminomutase